MKIREAAGVLERIGVAGYNKPKKTPSHPTKSHVVVAKEGEKVKTIRFGQQGMTGSPPREGESAMTVDVKYPCSSVFWSGPAPL